ncbi:hypothetical protein [Spiroplasma endosymbiont of Stenodema calcarata]|uniref:hypothetical protein n=1 Tax=Spiroplasma endosymbiont of Stenodema calcarata TaxID=3139328 RepID=UPI003CCB23DD
MNITESIKFDKLQEENEKLKNQLAEKDKEIEELKQQQLYKEDFDIGYTFDSEKNELVISSYRLKDNSLYDNLPSKEELK